jgi:hypothetical protein
MTPLVHNGIPVCQWYLEYPGVGRFYDTGCEGDPIPYYKLSDYKFCPYCGNRIYVPGLKEVP